MHRIVASIAFVLALATTVVASAAAGSVSKKPRPVGPPPTQPTAASCITTGYVVFLYSAGESGAPSNGACWSYNRPLQEPNTFTVCSVNPWETWKVRGWGPYYVYDDTNSADHGASNDQADINECIGAGAATWLWGDYMAGPSWSENLPSGVGITYAFAELYNSSCITQWTSPSWAVPVIDADCYSDTALYNQVRAQCYRYGGSPWTMSIYAESQMTSTKEATIDSALTSCYTS